MPYSRPTLTALRDNAIQDVAASRIYDATTGQTVNPVLLQFDPLTILAKVMAGLTYEEFGYLDYISLQATPFTATDETALGWGALVGITPKPATPAAATVIWSNLTSSAVDVPLGTEFARADQVSYSSTADVVIPAFGTVNIPVQADVAGAAGTIAAGATLTMSSPIAGLPVTGLVGNSVAPGADNETPDQFRARYLQRYAAPPQGGAGADYIEWATAVPGVTRAWVLSDVNGPGTVGLWVMFDGSEAAAGGFPVGSNGVSPLDNNGTPRAVVATGDQRTVANALVPLQPVTALVYVLAPQPLPINFTIANLGTANTLANQAAITAALNNALLGVGDPRGTTLTTSVWTSAVSGVVGAFTMAAPLAPVTVPIGFLPTIGTMTFLS